MIWKTCQHCGVQFRGNGRYYCTWKCFCDARGAHKPTREELEKLVWEAPVTAVAALYGVSDKAVEKWCRKARVAKPPRGYWAKVRAGKPVEKEAIVQLYQTRFEEVYDFFVGNLRRSGLVDAIFEQSTEARTRFYVVVSDHKMEVYHLIIELDTKASKGWPRASRSFELVVRAHQGRQPEDAVPPSCTVVWKKGIHD